ncbi:MAG: M48 family metalloprotease, partial [Candidatus Omnitrophota bacterium]
DLLVPLIMIERKENIFTYWAARGIHELDDEIRELYFNWFWFMEQFFHIRDMPGIMAFSPYLHESMYRKHLPGALPYGLVNNLDPEERAHYIIQQGDFDNQLIHIGRADLSLSDRKSSSSLESNRNGLDNCLFATVLLVGDGFACADILAKQGYYIIYTSHPDGVKRVLKHKEYYAHPDIIVLGNNMLEQGLANYFIGYIRNELKHGKIPILTLGKKEAGYSELLIKIQSVVRRIHEYREGWLSANCNQLSNAVNILYDYYSGSSYGERLITRYHLTGSLARGDFAVSPSDVDFTVSIRVNRENPFNLGIKNLLEEFKDLSIRSGIKFDLVLHAIGKEYEIREGGLVFNGDVLEEDILKRLNDWQAVRRRLIKMTDIQPYQCTADFFISVYRSIQALNSKDFGGVLSSSASSLNSSERNLRICPVLKIIDNYYFSIRGASPLTTLTSLVISFENIFSHSLGKSGLTEEDLKQSAPIFINTYKKFLEVLRIFFTGFGGKKMGYLYYSSPDPGDYILQAVNRLTSGIKRLWHSGNVTDIVILGESDYHLGAKSLHQILNGYMYNTAPARAGPRIYFTEGNLPFGNLRDFFTLNSIQINKSIIIIITEKEILFLGPALINRALEKSFSNDYVKSIISAVNLNELSLVERLSSYKQVAGVRAIFTPVALLCAGISGWDLGDFKKGVLRAYDRMATVRTLQELLNKYNRFHLYDGHLLENATEMRAISYRKDRISEAIDTYNSFEHKERMGILKELEILIKDCQFYKWLATRIRAERDYVYELSSLLYLMLAKNKINGIKIVLLDENLVAFADWYVQYYYEYISLIRNEIRNVPAWLKDKLTHLLSLEYQFSVEHELKSGAKPDLILFLAKDVLSEPQKRLIEQVSLNRIPNITINFSLTSDSIYTLMMIAVILGEFCGINAFGNDSVKGYKEAVDEALKVLSVSASPLERVMADLLLIFNLTADIVRGKIIELHKDHLDLFGDWNLKAWRSLHKTRLFDMDNIRALLEHSPPSNKTFVIMTFLNDFDKFLREKFPFLKETTLICGSHQIQGAINISISSKSVTVDHIESAPWNKFRKDPVLSLVGSGLIWFVYKGYLEQHSKVMRIRDPTPQGVAFFKRLFSRQSLLYTPAEVASFASRFENSYQVFYGSVNNTKPVPSASPLERALQKISLTTLDDNVSIRAAVQLLQQAGIQRGSQIIEVGTGSIRDIAMAAARIGARYICFEQRADYLNNFLIGIKHYNVREFGGSLNAVLGKFSINKGISSVIPDHSQDAVILFGVLSQNLLIGKDIINSEIMKEIFRIIKNNGKIIVGSYIGEQNSAEAEVRLGAREFEGEILLEEVRDFRINLRGMDYAGKIYEFNLSESQVAVDFESVSSPLDILLPKVVTANDLYKVIGKAKGENRIYLVKEYIGNAPCLFAESRAVMHDIFKVEKKGRETSIGYSYFDLKYIGLNKEQERGVLIGETGFRGGPDSFHIDYDEQDFRCHGAGSFLQYCRLRAAIDYGAVEFRIYNREAPRFYTQFGFSFMQDESGEWFMGVKNLASSEYFEFLEELMKPKEQKHSYKITYLGSASPVKIQLRSFLRLERYAYLAILSGLFYLNYGNLSNVIYYPVKVFLMLFLPIKLACGLISFLLVNKLSKNVDLSVESKAEVESEFIRFKSRKDLIIEKAFSGPMFEELVFRAAIFNLFCGGADLIGMQGVVWGIPAGIAVALVISSIIFWLPHFINRGIMHPAFFSGLIYGYVYWKTNSLLGPITLHMLNNIFSWGLLPVISGHPKKITDSESSLKSNKNASSSLELEGAEKAILLGRRKTSNEMYRDATSIILHFTRHHPQIISDNTLTALNNLISKEWLLCHDISINEVYHNALEAIGQIIEKRLDLISQETITKLSLFLLPYQHFELFDFVLHEKGAELIYKIGINKSELLYEALLALESVLLREPINGHSRMEVAYDNLARLSKDSPRPKGKNAYKIWLWFRSGIPFVFHLSQPFEKIYKEYKYLSEPEKYIETLWLRAGEVIQGKINRDDLDALYLAYIGIMAQGKNKIDYWEFERCLKIQDLAYEDKPQLTIPKKVNILTLAEIADTILAGRTPQVRSQGIFDALQQGHNLSSQLGIIKEESDALREIIGSGGQEALLKYADRYMELNKIITLTYFYLINMVLPFDRPEYTRAKGVLQIILGKNNISASYPLLIIKESKYFMGANATAEGSFITIESRLVNNAINDHELAAAISHEVAHCEKEHNRKNIEFTSMHGLPRNENKVLWESFSQEKELEADRLGAAYLYNAGYNYLALISVVLKIMRMNYTDAQNGKKFLKPEFIYKTHPNLIERFSAIAKEVRLLKSKVRESASPLEQLESRVASLWNASITADSECIIDSARALARHGYLISIMSGGLTKSEQEILNESGIVINPRMDFLEDLAKTVAFSPRDHPFHRYHILAFIYSMLLPDTSVDHAVRILLTRRLQGEIEVIILNPARVGLSIYSSIASYNYGLTFKQYTQTNVNCVKVNASLDDPNTLRDFKTDDPSVIRTIFGGSYAQTILKEKEGRFVIHKRANGKGYQKLVEEITWLRELPQDKKQLFPEIIDYHIGKEYAWFELQFYPWPNISNLIFWFGFSLSEDIAAKRIWAYMLRLYESLITKVYNIQVEETPSDFFDRFHYSKIMGRLRETCVSVPQLSEVIESPLINIEGSIMPGTLPLLELISQLNKATGILNPPYLAMTHGDLNMGNVLVNPMDIAREKDLPETK